MKAVSMLEFRCLTPLKFYEACSACARFEGCPDLGRSLEILKGGKKLVYNISDKNEDAVSLEDFNCLKPLHYVQRVVEGCPNHGSCWEEDSLIDLLSGRKVLDYGKPEG